MAAGSRRLVRAGPPAPLMVASRPHRTAIGALRAGCPGPARSLPGRCRACGRGRPPGSSRRPAAMRWPAEPRHRRPGRAGRRRWCGNARRPPAAAIRPRAHRLHRLQGGNAVEPREPVAFGHLRPHRVGMVARQPLERLDLRRAPQPPQAVAVPTRHASAGRALPPCRLVRCQPRAARRRRAGGTLPRDPAPLSRPGLPSAIGRPGPPPRLAAAAASVPDAAPVVADRPSAGRWPGQPSPGQAASGHRGPAIRLRGTADIGAARHRPRLDLRHGAGRGAHRTCGHSPQERTAP